MLLETFKSLLVRFTKHEPARKNNVPQSTLVPHPSMGECSQVPDTFPSRPLGTQLPLSSVAVPTLNPPSADSGPTSGFFAYSHHNVINNPTMVSNTFDAGGGAIMQLLETTTIQGAEHDSSARYPPPKCHPETRQTLRDEILDWILDPLRHWRMFYILGSAGVGKSAVAQTVADTSEDAGCLGASCFISRPNHRNDPDGVIPTLAYQLAVKHEVYKRIISQKITHDPAILRKTRRVQFKELLIDPFHIIMTQDPSAIQKPLLIIIDGLDECASQAAQCEFIELIGDHVRSFPQFPLLWLICSRPESHLKYILSQADFQVTCRRIEMTVDDEEGQEDVLIYLRSEFETIRRQYRSSLGDNWPPEDQLLRIAGAASGLFAFASTITRFVGDADAGDPSNQLQVFINILEGSNILGVENPYLTLDILYRHILASIPSKILPTTMRIIGMSIFYPLRLGKSARTQANFLKIKKATFEHALKQLHSVLRVDSSSDTFDGPIEFYHASFGDFLRDPDRSGDFCLDEAAIHYDFALTALSWHVELQHKIRNDDMWISPSEDAQTCLENVLALSLHDLWASCSHVHQKENAAILYQKLQEFNFNVLHSDIVVWWRFGEFLSWLNLQERDSLSPKLLSSPATYDDCRGTRFIDAIVEEATVPGFTPAGFRTRESSNMPKKIHLNLGHGTRCLHIHIIFKTPECPYLTVDVFHRNLLGNIHSEALSTMMRIIGMSILYPLQTGCQSARTQVNFLRISRAEFHRRPEQLGLVLSMGTPPDAFHNSIEIQGVFADFLRDPGRSGEYCLDVPAVHYDIGLTALSWLREAGHEVRKDDLWILPSEDVRTCVEDIKLLALSVFWEACSRADGENAIDLYAKLQQFDFSILDGDIPLEWEFGAFLGWLNLQERDASTPKLLNSLATYEECDEIGFTEVAVNETSLPSFTPEGFVDREPLGSIHLDLGYGRRRRHIHVFVESDSSEDSELDYMDLED